MKELRAGARYPGWVSPMTEGARFEVDRNGLLLLHVYRDPTPAEVAGAREGRARFGIVPAGDHTLLLIYDIAGLTQGWSDAPFAMGLVSPDRRGLEPRAPTQGRLLTSVLLDADRGTVLALRAISLTPAFCEALDREILRQQKALSRFTPQIGADELQRAYARWPDAAALAAGATAIEVGGLEF